MKLATLALASAFALSSTFAFAQVIIREPTPRGIRVSTAAATVSTMAARTIEADGEAAGTPALAATVSTTATRTIEADW